LGFSSDGLSPDRGENKALLGADIMIEVVTWACCIVCCGNKGLVCGPEGAVDETALIGQKFDFYLRQATPNRC